MERIVIREVDNTTNFENLSSYDVVYVPGFASIQNEEKAKLYFRNPTLVTNKYEFIQLFGHTAGSDTDSGARDVDVPLFSKDQQYPVAPQFSSSAGYGFPDWAIPNSSAVKSGVSLNLTDFDTLEDIVSPLPDDGEVPSSDRVVVYTKVNTGREDNFTPEEGVVYFKATREDEESPYLISEFNREIDTPVPYYPDVQTNDFSFDDPENAAAAVSDSGIYTLLEAEETITASNYTDYFDETELAAGRYVYFGDEDIDTDENIVTVHTFATSSPAVDSDFEGRTFFLGVNPSSVPWYVNTGTTENPVWVQTEDTYINTEADPPVQYYRKADDYSGYNLYTGVSPATEGFNERSASGDYSVTTDAVIDLEKTYYIITDGNAVMFKEGTPDPGFRYALLLLSLGIPVYYEQMNMVDNDVTKRDGEDVTYGIDLEAMYSGLINRFDTDPTDYSFDNIGDFAIKYMTTGGYPVYEYGQLVTDSATQVTTCTSPLAQSIVRLCSKRGDAVALIDHTDNPNRSILATNLVENDSVIDKIRLGNGGIIGGSEELDSHAAMFSPWYYCTHQAITGTNLFNNVSTTDDQDTEQSNAMPGSLAFLSALASQIQSYNPWLAVSGVTRGRVPYCAGLHLTPPKVLTNNIADTYQSLPDELATNSSISINPITYIRNYGYCIWGNRTLRNNTNGTKATSFLNIRNVISDIKKRLYETSQRLLFDQNSEVLWIDFKTLVTPLLDSMVSNYILSDYKITRLSVDPDTGRPVPAYKVLAVLRIMPINSVEVFDLTVQLENSIVDFVEETVE